MNERLTFLRTIPFLAAVPEDILIEMECQATDRRYQPGQLLIRDGEPGEFLLALRSGRVKIIKEGRVIAHREAGDILGEMALLESQPRFADVVALAPTEAVEIPYGPFRQVGRDAAAMRRMLGVLSLKLRQAQEARLQEFRRREQELQGLADLQRAFLSVINHELTTPLSNALLAQEVLGKFAVRDNWDEMARESLAQLQRHLQLARQRIRTVIDYADLVAGQGEMFIEPVDLVKIARRVIAQAPRPIEADLVVDPPPARGDRQRLGEAIGHLVDNACRFSPPGTPVKARLWPEADTVRFEVVDRGPGIPVERLAGLWQPFRQQAGVVRRGVEGLGLGLPLTRYIVRAHGGQVWGKSVVGQGSRFGFWLPTVETNA